MTAMGARDGGVIKQFAGIKLIEQSVAPPEDDESTLYRIGHRWFLRDSTGVVLPLVPSADGAGVKSIVAADSPYTLATYEILAMVNTIGGAVTVRLPLAADIQVGHRVKVVDQLRNFAVNNCTVDGNGATINGSATLVLSAQDGGGEFIWNGTTWSRDAVGGVTLNGTTTIPDGAVLQLLGAGTGAGDVIERIGATATEGLELKVIDVTVTPAAVETAIATLPAGSIPIAVQANVQSALTGGGTTVTWSIGTAASPNKYGTAGFPSAADALTKNSKSRFLGPFTQLTSAEPIVLTGAASGGAADGNTALTVGSVRVRIVYWTINDLDDAP